MDYRTSVNEITVGDLRFRVHGIQNPEDAIDRMFVELQRRGCPDLLEELCPYFGTLWPSGYRLSRWVWDQGRGAFAGRRVLELGCGLALPSFVAAHLGADAVATDVHPDVPTFLAQNLKENPTASIRYLRLDWRDTPTTAEGWDWILASDVMYERNQAETLVRFLDRSLRPGARAVVVDPDRTYWRRLVVCAESAGMVARIEHLAPEMPLDPRQAVLIHLSRS